MRRFLNLLLIFTTFAAFTAAPGLARYLGPNPPSGPVSPKVFMPIVAHPAYSMAGKVLDVSNKPVAGVTISTESGQKAVTDASGAYALQGLTAGQHAISPAKTGMVFTPSALEVKLKSSLTNLIFKALAPKADALGGAGDMETDGYWSLSAENAAANTVVAGFSGTVVHSGARSALVGITEGNPNRLGYSYIRSQLIPVASNIGYATLRVWLYQATTETMAMMPAGSKEAIAANKLAARRPVGDLSALAASTDAQYVSVLDSAGNTLSTPLWVRSNARSWQIFEFNLAPFAGQTIQLEIGAFNDGTGGITYQYVDDVTLDMDIIGGGGSITPPAPGFGSDLILNGGFELNNGWTIQPSPYPAVYANENPHTGSRSMHLGPYSSYVNIGQPFASEIWQQVSIPVTATQAWLSLYWYPISTVYAASAQPEVEPHFQVGQKWGQGINKPLDSADAQYLLVLDQYGNLQQTLMYRSKFSPVWDLHQFDLAAYAGQTIRILIGVYNDGYNGIASLYVDDVTLNVSGSGATATPAPTATPGPTATPTITPTTNCTEQIGNGNMEGDGYWLVPLTNYTAGYSTALVRSGSWSMRSGIVSQAHNRYSYSDFFQYVTIPWNSSTDTLTYYMYPIVSNTWYWGYPPLPVGLENDVQYLLVLDEWGNWINRLEWGLSDARTWNLKQFDMTPYRGMTIRLQWGTYNDGWNNVTAQYVDDVSLKTCP